MPARSGASHNERASTGSSPSAGGSPAGPRPARRQVRSASQPLAIQPPGRRRYAPFNRHVTSIRATSEAHMASRKTAATVAKQRKVQREIDAAEKKTSSSKK